MSRKNKVSLSSQLDVLIKLAEEDLLDSKDSKEESSHDCDCENKDECDCDEAKPELEGKEAQALSMLAKALRSKEASVTYDDLLDYLRGM